MIKIDFSSAIAIYLSFSIVLVFVLWLFYTMRRGDILNETKYLQQCPYCTYMFFNYRLAEDVSQLTHDTKSEEALILNAQEPTQESSFEEKDSQTNKVNVLICPQCRSYINLDDANSEGDR